MEIWGLLVWLFKGGFNVSLGIVGGKEEVISETASPEIRGFVRRLYRVYVVYVPQGLPLLWPHIRSMATRTVYNIIYVKHARSDMSNY